jgi:hypothetical protein
MTLEIEACLQVPALRLTCPLPAASLGAVHPDGICIVTTPPLAGPLVVAANVNWSVSPVAPAVAWPGETVIVPSPESFDALELLMSISAATASTATATNLRTESTCRKHRPYHGEDSIHSPVPEVHRCPPEFAA